VGGTVSSVRVAPKQQAREDKNRMTKKLGPGSEIDAWCTKCKLDLGHRIIAMLGDQPKRVECRTCGSHHNYYKPKNGPASLPGKAAKAPGTAAPRSSRSGSSVGVRAMAAAKLEQDRERTWEKMVSGFGVNDFAPYRVSTSFEEGVLLRHPKFGDGYVTRVVDKNKIEVMFREGARTLAHGIAN
jgi:hypothetical protein